MSLRDRMFELTEIEHVDEFMKAYPTAAFFKAGGCHKTMQGFGYVEQAFNPRPNLYLGFVRVIECRPVSNYISQLTGVVHQSPQLILFKEKEVVYDVDNWNITPEALDAALMQHFGKVQSSSLQSNSLLGNISPYLDLLTSYLTNEIPEEEFQVSWLTTFQSDATPRSMEEFNLLNSLFGDVDFAIAKGPFSLDGEDDLRDRAQRLCDTLVALSLQ